MDGWSEQVPDDYPAALLYEICHWTTHLPPTDDHSCLPVTVQSPSSSDRLADAVAPSSIKFRSRSGIPVI